MLFLYFARFRGLHTLPPIRPVFGVALDGAASPPVILTRGADGKRFPLILLLPRPLPLLVSPLTSKTGADWHSGMPTRTRLRFEKGEKREQGTRDKGRGFSASATPVHLRKNYFDASIQRRRLRGAAERKVQWTPSNHKTGDPQEPRECERILPNHPT